MDPSERYREKYEILYREYGISQRMGEDEEYIKKEAHKGASKLPIGNMCHYIKYRTHSLHFSDVAQAYGDLLW